MRTVIERGCIVNEGESYEGSVIIEDGDIIDIIRGKEYPEGPFDQRVDASGCLILPGIIDDHVHFREPGLTAKADMESESRAAAAGGVTSFLEMPNTVPQTTTLEALDEKYRLAATKSHVNYAFFFGATNDNTHLFAQLDEHRVPGIKLFMGSSTGNMLVDQQEALEQIFSTAHLPVMTHCEDTTIINRNMERAKAVYGDDPAVAQHPLIRSEEACYESTRLAVSLAKKYHTRLHVAHVTTAKELAFFGEDPLITAEATVGHLFFTDEDYVRLGALIKVNPAIKSRRDRDALREALSDGRISMVGTDHAPHLLEQKQGGCVKAASGMPMIQFSLVTMLELVNQGVLTVERLVELMCHQPARLFEISRRGFVRKGYRADLVMVRPEVSWTVRKTDILSKCGWSPMEGNTYSWKVEKTWCNGHIVYANGRVDTNYIGESIIFRS